MEALIHTTVTMAHHDVRLNRYEEFNPETSKWRDDKRMYDRAVGGFQVLVAKNYSALGIPCAAIYPEIVKGKFVGCKFVAPEGPLKDYFDQPDTKHRYFELLQDAFFEALKKKEMKREGQNVKTSAKETRLVGFAEPPRPIWMLTVKELETYFSGLKTMLAAEDKIKIKRKWPKIENGIVVKHPTEIPLLDEIAEKILPSDAFIPGQKFAPGNLQWRLSLVCAYIMLQNGHDPNTFANDIPEDFEPKEFTLKDVEEFSKNIDQLVKANQKKKKTAEYEHHIPFYALDDATTNFDPSDSETDREKSDHGESGHEESDHDENDKSKGSRNPFVDSSPPAVTSGREEQPTIERSSVQDIASLPSGSSSSPPPARSSMPSGSSRTKPIILNPSHKKTVLFDGSLSVSMPVPDDVFFDIDEVGLNTSHVSGTPGNSEKGDDETDDEVTMARMAEEKEDRDELQKMMEDTDIWNLLIGQKCSHVVLQMYNFQKLGRGKCFRAHAQNGKVASTKVSFSPTLNEKTEELDKKLPVVKVTEYQLFNGSFLFIKSFEVLQILDSLLGSPDYLTEKDYKNIQKISKPNTNLPQTPSMVNRKLTDKHVAESNVKPRSNSQRQTKRNNGSNM